MLQSADHSFVDVFQQRHNDLYGGFKVKAAADAVGGVGISDRNACNDGRGADPGGLDGGCVVAAALTDRFLHRDTLFGRQIQGVPLVPGRADGGYIHVAEHGTLFQGCLDGIGLGKGVVSRAAFHYDADVGMYPVDGHLAVPGTKLLLGGQHGHYIAGQFFTFQTAQGFQHGGAADSAVKSFAEQQIVLFIIREFGSGHDRLSDPDVEFLHSLLGRAGTDVDDHVVDLQGRIAPLSGGHEMHRLGGDDAGNILAQGVANQHLGGDQGIFIPAAQAQKTQGSVGLDGVDENCDFPGYELLLQAGKKRGFLLRGNEINTERMAKVLVDEYRSGKLGRFTLEMPEVDV